MIAALFVPFDFLYRERLAATLAARTTLMAALGACWWLLGRVGPRAARRLVAAGATAAAILTPLTVIAASGSTGSRFGFVLVVPFIVLALLPDVPAIAAAAGLIAAIAGGAAMVLDGQPPARVVEWITMAAAITGVTAYAARRTAALAGRARTAEQERRRAVADLEESERRRSASERLALVGRLASGIGHELNNPLSAVKGNVACALEELQRTGGPPEAREALAEALAAVARIAWISSDLRALTGDAAAPLVPCEVGSAIRDALDRTAERVGLTNVVLDLEPGLPPVRSEPRLLTDALGQLVSQAAAARAPRPDGVPPTVRISARRVGDGIEIAIEDEGPRIPEHVLARIFEPFAAQGEVRGAGLGLTLPLTRELAERGGGSVGAGWHASGNRYVLRLAASAD